MHFTKLIKLSSAVVITQPPTTTNVNDDSNNDAFNQILELLKQNNTGNSGTPVVTQICDDTELEDDEINHILSMLLDFQEKYFSEIPLSKDLCRKFMWNIPKKVYKAAAKAESYGYDFLNPLILLYALCVDDPDFAMGKYMSTLMSSMTDDDCDLISQKSSEYDEAYSDEESDDADEDAE